MVNVQTKLSDVNFTICIVGDEFTKLLLT